MTAAPELRLKVPSSDAREFFARLADHAAERGLRFPTETRRPLGTPVTVALELRNGETLRGEGVVDGHVELEGRPAVNVRILRLEPGADPWPAAPARRRAAPEEGPAAPPGAPALGELLFGDAAEGAGEGAGEAARDGFGWSTLSGEIFAQVRRRTARVQRAALAVAAAALLVAAAAFAAVRWLPSPGADAVSAAHLQVSDRLIAEGRLVGEGGAIEHLLAARRLRPEDPAAAGRLARLADLLEALAARALERGDAAVAAVHLGWAQQAAPDRASIRARLEALGAGEAPAAQPRGTAGAGAAPRR